MTGNSWTKAELFAGLTAEELAAIHPAFETVELPAGREVIVEGEPGDEMFILVAGRVRVSKSMPAMRGCCSR